MKAMILAAGLGTRLRPLTNTTPKPLLPVAGRPLIDWTLLLLRRHGITDVVINLHHLASQIREAVGDGARFGMRVTFSEEPTILGTGGGIKQVEPWFGGKPFLVLNGDTLVDLDLTAVMRFHSERNAFATMVVRADPDVQQWGVLEVDASGNVARINGRGRQHDGPVRPFMFAGVHVMDTRLLREVPAGVAFSIIDAYAKALGQGEPVGGYVMDGYWSDVGTVARYERAQLDAKHGRIRLADRERSL